MPRYRIAFASCVLAVASLALNSTAQATTDIGSWWGILIRCSGRQNGAFVQGHYINTTGNLSRMDGFNVHARTGYYVRDVEVWETQGSYSSNHILFPFTSDRVQQSGYDIETSDLPWLRRTSGEIVMHIAAMDSYGSDICSYNYPM